MIDFWAFDIIKRIALIDYIKIYIFISNFNLLLNLVNVIYYTTFTSTKEVNTLFELHWKQISSLNKLIESL